MVTDKGMKRGSDSKRRSFINFISSFSASSCEPTPHQKSIWREPAFLPSASNTKAEAERTHTKRMDIVKKEEIYKGAETLGAERDREGDSETHWAPDYSGRDGSKKKMLFWEEIRILSQSVGMERNERIREWEDVQR